MESKNKVMVTDVKIPAVTSNVTPTSVLPKTYVAILSITYNDVPRASIENPVRIDLTVSLSL